MSQKSVIFLKTTFAFSSLSICSGSDPVFTATVNMPAATAARTPKGAFFQSHHSWHYSRHSHAVVS